MRFPYLQKRFAALRHDSYYMGRRPDVNIFLCNAQKNVQEAFIMYIHKVR